MQCRDLPTEEELIASWSPGLEAPLVSISCCAYNHEAYIESALCGFLSQETDFPFEVLVHDDASTDATAEIIRHYHAHYPSIIKPILQVENQYSKGNNKPALINSMRAMGEFTAICEGDDCWTDTKKLQYQVEALRQYPNVDICFHSASKRDYANGGKETLIGRYAEEPVALLSTEQVILRPHGLIPTASVMVRREVVKASMEFRETRPYIAVGDIYLFFFGARRGGAVYLDRNMSLYRAKVPGSWTLKNKSDYVKRMQAVNARVLSYVELDEYTGYQFTHALMQDNNSRIMGILKENSIPVMEKVRFYRHHARLLNMKNKCMSLLAIFGSPLWYKVKSC